MLKLQYVPTGNIFTLPDEEALRIKETDRGNYKILDPNFKDEPEVIEKPKTVKEIVMPEKDEEKEVELPPAKQEELEEPQEKARMTVDELKDLDRFALYGLAQRLDLKPKSNANKATLLKLLKESGNFD